MSWFRRLAIALALTLVLAACGSDDDTSTDAGTDAEYREPDDADYHPKADSPLPEILRIEYRINGLPYKIIQHCFRPSARSFL